MKKLIISLGIAVALVFLFLSAKSWYKESNILTFEDCVNAGYPVMESYPRQCRAGDKNFVEEISGPESYKDKIEVSNIKSGSVIGKSPVHIEGRARGVWFFEASFPIKIVDAGNNVLGTGIAQAKSDWMTEEYVDFEADVIFSESPTIHGAIHLIKDNPSGLPEFDDVFIIPIKFK